MRADEEGCCWGAASLLYGSNPQRGGPEGDAERFFLGRLRERRATIRLICPSGSEEPGRVEIAPPFFGNDVQLPYGLRECPSVAASGQDLQVPRQHENFCEPILRSCKSLL